MEKKPLEVIDLSKSSNWPPYLRFSAARLNQLSFNSSIEISYFVAFLKNHFQLEAAVETGTWWGYTTIFLSTIFNEVHTIEIREAEYRQANQLLSHFPNIKTYLGNSEKILPEILPALRGKRTFFYLDAHSSGKWPLLNEFELIGSTHYDNSVILIDDIKVPERPDIEYDVFEGQECSFDYVEKQFDLVFSNPSCRYVIPEKVASRAKLLIYPTHWNTNFIL